MWTPTWDSDTNRGSYMSDLCRFEDTRERRCLYGPAYGWVNFTGYDGRRFELTV